MLLLNTGTVLNGSRLGKEYSANAIVDKLNIPMSKRQAEYKFKNKIPIKLGGLALTDVQRINLDNGKTVYLENLTNRYGEVHNAYAKWSKYDDKLMFYKYNPDTSLSPVQNQSPSQEQTEQTNNLSESFSGLGLFDLPLAPTDDPEEDIFRRRMQQQKKKKRGIKR